MDKKRGNLILVTGGSRSGKSTFAEKYARESGRKVVYIATAQGNDEEMRIRIREHRAHRLSQFITKEEPYYPHRIIEKEGGKKTFIILDCLTILLSNHLLKETDSEKNRREPRSKVSAILEYVSFLTVKMKYCTAHVLVVTNEVGMGVVPDNPLARIFRDLAGKAGQSIAGQADEVWLTVCGIPWRIK